MALSENKHRNLGTTLIANRLAVVGSDTVFIGSLAGDNGSGYARPLTQGDPFLGLSREKVDNSTGADGAKSCDLITEGEFWSAVTGVNGVDDIGKAVYASDDDTLTTTATGNSFVGHVRGWAGSEALIRFRANKPASAIADPSGGATQDAEARTAIGSIIDALEGVGIVVPS